MCTTNDDSLSHDRGQVPSSVSCPCISQQCCDKVRNMTPRNRKSRSLPRSKLSAFPAAATFVLFMTTSSSHNTHVNASRSSSTCSRQDSSMARRQSAFVPLSRSSGHDRKAVEDSDSSHTGMPGPSFSNVPYSGFSHGPLHAAFIEEDTITDAYTIISTKPKIVRNGASAKNSSDKVDHNTLLEEKRLKLKSSIHYHAIPYRGDKSYIASRKLLKKKNGAAYGLHNLHNGTLYPTVQVPLMKDRVVNFTIERKFQLTAAINNAMSPDGRKNGKTKNGKAKNGASQTSSSSSENIKVTAPAVSSKKLTIRNLWKRRHAQSIDQGIRRERIIEPVSTGKKLSDILDETTDQEGGNKRKPRRYAARTIAGLISALAEEATGLEVAVDARNDTPLWKKQIDAVEINFSRLGVRALRMGGLDEAFIDMNEDLSPFEKEIMADSLHEEAKSAYSDINLMDTPPSDSTIDEIFDRIDTDNSGTLDEEELTRALSIASGLSNSPDDENSSSALSKLVSRLINLYDTNGDGVVDREEYRNLVEDMTHVRNTQRLKQKEREEKEQERLERRWGLHPLKWARMASRTFQRWTRKEATGNLSDKGNRSVEPPIKTQRESQNSNLRSPQSRATSVATIDEGDSVDFVGAQDISDDPSLMKTITKGEGSIKFSDLKLDLRRLVFGAVPLVKRITPGGPLILEPFTMSLKGSFTKEDLLESGLLDDGLRRLVARALRRRVRGIRDLVDGAVFYGRTWNMASRHAPVVEVPKLIDIEFDSKNKLIITGRAKVQTAPDQPFVENSFKLRTKLGTREDGQFIRLEEPELALIIECPKAWERNIVSACKNLDLPIPTKPEPLYQFFPLVSPIKKTDQDGFNLGDDNRIHSIYVKDNALRFEMSAVLRPGRFLGNHYLAFTLPNRTFIVTMDRIKEGIRTARQNKRELEQIKRNAEMSKKKEASDRYNRAVAEALSSSYSSGASDAENIDLSYKKELDQSLSFLEPAKDTSKESAAAESEIVANNRPGFFGRFLEGYLEAAREETERERNESLTTAISEFFSPVEDSEIHNIDTSDETIVEGTSDEEI